jgi:hypothetical protein
LPTTPPPIADSFDFERWQPGIDSPVFAALS